MASRHKHWHIILFVSDTAARLHRRGRTCRSQASLRSSCRPARSGRAMTAGGGWPVSLPQSSSSGDKRSATLAASRGEDLSCKDHLGHALPASSWAHRSGIAAGGTLLWGGDGPKAACRYCDHFVRAAGKADDRKTRGETLRTVWGRGSKRQAATVCKEIWCAMRQGQGANLEAASRCWNARKWTDYGSTWPEEAIHFQPVNSDPPVVARLPVHQAHVVHDGTNRPRIDSPLAIAWQHH